MDDTAEDRKAIQPVINQIVAYPLKDFDGKMKTKDWSKAPAIPGPKSRRRRDEVGRPGEILRSTRRGARFRAATSRRRGALRPVSGAARFRGERPGDQEGAGRCRGRNREGCHREPFFQWKHNGRPAGNGWNRSTNNAQFGIDYFNRTGTAKSNMFDNKPTETQYFYTDDDSAGGSLDGKNSYESHVRAGPGTAGEWFLVDDTLQRGALLPPERPEAVLAGHEEQEL